MAWKSKWKSWWWCEKDESSKEGMKSETTQKDRPPASLLSREYLSVEWCSIFSSFSFNFFFCRKNEDRLPRGEPCFLCFFSFSFSFDCFSLFIRTFEERFIRFLSYLFVHSILLSLNKGNYFFLRIE